VKNSVVQHPASHLATHAVVQHGALRPAGIVHRIGIGFGTRTFVGLSNIVRATLSRVASETTTSPWTTRTLVQLGCDIDDMTAEELAHAATTLRDVDGIIDVSLVPTLMKKGRPGTTVLVLCEPRVRDDAAAAMFSSTTTLGLRCTSLDRLELMRSEAQVDRVRVKTAARPVGATHKADHDDVVGDTLAERRAARARAEAAIDAQGPGTVPGGERGTDG
jgi:uncharacterized protein (DUF111 family)